MGRRADLLRTLAEAEEALGADALRAGRLAGLLGFEGGGFPERDSRTYDAPGGEDRPAEGNRSSAGSRAPMYTARRPIGIWAVTACEPVTREGAGEEPPLPAPAAPSRPLRRSFIPAPPLRISGQWQNLWDRVIIGHGNGRRIDLKRCLRDLSQARPIQRLPLLPRRHFNGPITVIIDRPTRLRQAFGDLRAAWRSLVALVGRQGLEGYQLRRGPNGLWERLDGKLSVVHAPAIKPESQVLLLGAFGALEDGQIRADWRGLITGLKRRGHRMHLLSVCPIHQPPAECIALDPRQGGADAGRLEQAVHALLAALAHCWRANEAQLRYLRHAIPGATLYAELRLAYHPAVIDDDAYLQLAAERLPEYLEAFARLPEKLREELDQALEAWRETRNGRAREMEALQSGLLDAPAPKDFPRLMNRLSALAGQAGKLTDISLELIAYLPLLDQLAKYNPDPGWRPVLREARRAARALDEPLPGGYHPEEFPDSEATPSRWLCQSHAGLVIRTRPERALLALGANPYSPADGRIIRDALPTAGATAEVMDRGWHYRLQKIECPQWAERIWQDKDGLLHLAHAEGAVFVLTNAGPDQPEARWRCIENPWPWAEAVGVDEQEGGLCLWADLRIGKAVQRLRWIPPGEFEMGSPEDEPERVDSEKLHHVTLTRGYWLAESACTQELWQAVMGKNPARFKESPEHPVEQVSWADCQRFVEKANEQLKGGLTLRLPTEAEWEYACRAGTATIFSWGDTLTTEQASYDGSWPYNDGPKGEYRQKTLPVHSFKPNPWGLYQMHGNVLEWCADWHGKYPGGPITDPTGPAKGQGRVLRGGGWASNGRLLRSARRLGLSPGNRARSIGLRLAGGSDPQAGPGAAGMSADR